LDNIRGVTEISSNQISPIKEISVQNKVEANQRVGLKKNVLKMWAHFRTPSGIPYTLRHQKVTDITTNGNHF